MDVDHAEEQILTIGTRDASVDPGGITATMTLTETATGDIGMGTGTVTETGVAAAVRLWQSKMHAFAILMVQLTSFD